MPSVRLVDHRVPLIQQNKWMSCWYASAQMVLAYRSPITMLVNTSSNPDTLLRYLEDQGIAYWSITRFAAEVGLSGRMPAQLITSKSIGGWAKALKTYGPLWTWIQKSANGNTYEHIVVVRGAQSNGELWINDPEEAAPVAKPAAAFSAAVRWSLPMLYKLTAGAL